MDLNYEVGGAEANSYNSIEEGDDFFESWPNSAAWTDAASASPDVRPSWLIASAFRLEEEAWLGERADEEQALAFPRSGLVVDGVELDDDSIPARVKRAHLKLALVIGQDETFLTESGLEDFDEVEVGPIRVKVRHGRLSGALPSDVMRELRPFLATSLIQFPIALG